MSSAVKHTQLISRPCKRQVQSSPAEGTKLWTHLHSAATHNSRPAAGSPWTPPPDPFTDPTAGTQGPHYLTPSFESSRPAAGTHRTPPPDPFTHQPHAQYTACCRHSPNPPTWPLHSNATRTVHSMLLVLTRPHHRTPSLTLLLALTGPHHRTPSLTLLLALTGPHHLTPSLTLLLALTGPLHSPCCWHSPDPTTWRLHSPCCSHSPDPFTHPAAGTRGLQQNPTKAEQGANGESACWHWQLPLPAFNNRFTGEPIDDDLGADVNVYTVHFVTRLFGSIPRSISHPPPHITNVIKTCTGLSRWR